MAHIQKAIAEIYLAERVLETRLGKATLRVLRKQIRPCCGEQDDQSETKHNQQTTLHFCSGFCDSLVRFCTTHGEVF